VSEIRNGHLSVPGLWPFLHLLYNFDHSTPVWTPIGSDKPGPAFDTPLPNYGVYSSLHKKRFIVGADGQCHAEKYSFNHQK